MSTRPVQASASSNGDLGLRLLLDKLPAGAYTCDAGGLITYFNRHAVTVWGRAPRLNDPVDKYCGSFKLFASNGTPLKHDECWMALALHNRREYNGEEIIVERPDGERSTVLAYAGPIWDGDRMAGAVNVLVDITHQKRTQQELESLTRTLEQRVEERTAELRSLTAELTRAEERERRRVANILHDHLQQLLVAAKFQMHTLRAQSSVAKIRPLCQEINELLDQCVDVSRSLAVELSPPILYEQGLVAGLVWLQRWMREKHQLIVHCELDSFEPGSPDVRILLFHAARELLFNVVKHARTKEAWLNLRLRDGRVELAVKDHGAGFSGPKPLNNGSATGHGLRSLRERFRLLGGGMQTASSADNGTCVTLYLPEGED